MFFVKMKEHYRNGYPQAVNSGMWKEKNSEFSIGSKIGKKLG